MKKYGFHFILAGVSFVFFLLSLVIGIKIYNSPICYNVDYRNDKQTIRFYRTGEVKSSLSISGYIELTSLYVIGNLYSHYDDSQMIYIIQPRKRYDDGEIYIDTFDYLIENKYSLIGEGGEFKATYDPTIIYFFVAAISAIAFITFLVLGIKTQE
jgi:hypothetical protein